MAPHRAQPSRTPRPKAPAPPQADRRHSRFSVALAVRCTRLNARMFERWRGRTADVSGGGFAIDLPTRVRPRTSVTVEVRTGIGPMRMDAEILWTRSIPGRIGIYRHGLCLADQTEMLQLPLGVLLGQWLQHCANHAPPARSPKVRRRASPRGHRPGRS